MPYRDIVGLQRLNLGLVWGNGIFAGRPGLRPQYLPQGDMAVLEKRTSSLGLKVKRAFVFRFVFCILMHHRVAIGLLVACSRRFLLLNSQLPAM